MSRTMDLNARGRLRSPKGPSSYGTCNGCTPNITTGQEDDSYNDLGIRHHLLCSRSFSMSSSSDGSDADGPEEELVGPLASSLPYDLETPPLPQDNRILDDARKPSRLKLEMKNGDPQNIKDSHELSPLQPKQRNQRRQVSFLEDSLSNLCNTEETIQPKAHYGPARSREFQESWRRKSSRRISLLLGTPSPPSKVDKRKTAKEHWAILRDHVVSGKFFLDESAASYNSTYRCNGINCDKYSRTSMNTRPSYIQRRHSSMARSLTNEIRSGLEFTVFQSVVAIIAYLMLAVICFSFLLEETRHDWTIIDSMYFAVAMFTTVGFGDLTPPRNSPVAYLLTSAFSLSGVACLGIALGIIGHRLVELESKAMDRAQKDVLTLFSTLSPASSGEEDDKPIIGSLDNVLEATLGKDNNASNKCFQNNEASSKLWTSTLGRLSTSHSKTTPFKKDSWSQKQNPPKKRSFQLSFNYINRQFVVLLGSIVIISYLIGNDAGWNFTETLYFAITTSCTIGFGDLVVTSQTGRLLVVAFIPVAVGAMGFLLQRIAEAMLRAKRRKHMIGIFGSGDMISPTGRQRQRELTVMDLEAMDSDGDGNVDWSEFLEFMLVAMKKVDEDLMWELRYQFDSLDVDDTGVLSKENLIAMARRRLHQTSHKLHLLQYKQHLLETGECRNRLDSTSTHAGAELV